MSPDGRSLQFRPPNTPGNERSDKPSAQKPRLGVMLQPLTEQMGEFLGVPKKKGALVVSVDADSPSDGKIKSGDVIIGADNKNIDSPEDLTVFIRNSAGGDITLKVIRDKKEMKIVINLPGDDSKKGYKL